MGQRESKLSRSIILELEQRGIFAFKVHGGPFMMAGLPDIIICHEGKFKAIETKMPEGGQPTSIQRFVHSRIRNAGGEVIVARSVKQALIHLRLEP